MTVILTSQVEGKQPGETYTGPNEAFHLAEGYAKRARYKGPGLLNTGETTIKPAKDPRLAVNREAPTEDAPVGDAGTPDGPVTEKQADKVEGSVDEKRTDGDKPDNR